MKHAALCPLPQAALNYSRIKRFPLLILSLVLLLPPFLKAQLEISGTGVFTIDFDNTIFGVNNGPFAGSGFAPVPSAGQLDSDAWASTGMSDGNLGFGGTGTTGDFARGTSNGGVGTGGFYSFTTGTNDNCLGIQPGGSDWTPGTITLKIKNTSSSPITSFQLSYEIKVYNDKDRSNSFNFSHSLDDISYTAVSALDYASPATADVSPAWQTITRSVTLSGLNIPINGFYYLRWTGDDVSGAGSRDEFGLDDVSVSSAVLPINLLDFRTQSKVGGVLLKWTTESETNNELFIVQRKVNSEGFHEIARVKGQGTTYETHRYTYTDSHPTPGINYYRLKQVDFNGNYTYSRVVEAWWEKGEDFRLYPTLVISELHIVLPENWQEKEDIILFNLLGQVLKTWHLEGSSHEATLDMSDLPPGPYFLEALSNHRRAVQKFEKR